MADTSRILKYAARTDGMFAVFEDDHETGYLYLYDPKSRGVIDHMQVYGPSEVHLVQEEEVNVGWSVDGQKCAVIIWSGLQAAWDVEKDRRVRCDPMLPGQGIDTQEWVRGFEHYLAG